MENYKYILKYVNDDKELTSTFGAEINLNDLKAQLKYFLRGCGWSESQTAFLDTEEQMQALLIILVFLWIAKEV